MKTAIKITLALICASGIIVNFTVLAIDGYKKQPWINIGDFAICLVLALFIDKIEDFLLELKVIELSRHYKNADYLELSDSSKKINRYAVIFLIICGCVSTAHLLINR